MTELYDLATEMANEILRLTAKNGLPFLSAVEVIKRNYPELTLDEAIASARDIYVEAMGIPEGDRKSGSAYFSAEMVAMMNM